MQSINPNGIQIIVVTQPTSATKQICYTNMKKELAKKLILLGVMQITIGVLCSIYQAASLWVTLSNELESAARRGEGFWLGALFIITGTFGIVGGIEKKRCKVITFSVLSIISASVCLVLINLAVTSAIIYNGNCLHTLLPSCSRASKAGITMEAAKVIVGLLEIVSAIWSSIVCCSVGACCCDCGGFCCCPPST